MWQRHKIEKKTTILNLRNVPINDEDLPNFMIESTNREREEVEVQKERIYVSVELLKVRSGRQVPDNVGIAHEIRSQTMANGPPLYSLLAFDSPSSTFVSREYLFSHLTISSSSSLYSRTCLN